MYTRERSAAGWRRSFQTSVHFLEKVKEIPIDGEQASALALDQHQQVVAEATPRRPRREGSRLGTVRYQDGSLPALRTYIYYSLKQLGWTRDEWESLFAVAAHFESV